MCSVAIWLCRPVRAAGHSSGTGGSFVSGGCLDGGERSPSGMAPTGCRRRDGRSPMGAWHATNQEVCRLLHGAAPKSSASAPQEQRRARRLAADVGAPANDLPIPLQGPSRRHPVPHGAMRAALAVWRSDSERASNCAEDLWAASTADARRHADAATHLRVHRAGRLAGLVGIHGRCPEHGSITSDRMVVVSLR